MASADKKGFILWHPDLQRIGYVYGSRLGAEKARFKETLSKIYYVKTEASPADAGPGALDRCLGKAAEENRSSPYEIREVLITLLDLEEPA